MGRHTTSTERRCTRSVLASRIFLGVYLALVLAPLGTVALWAFTDRWPWPDLLPAEFSVRGIVELFSGTTGVGGVLLTSILIAVAVSVLSVVVGALSARALVFHSFRGKDLFRFATILPFIVPATVFAMGVQVAFLRIGLGRTLLGVILVHTVVALPYAIAIMTDVMAAVGPRLEEQSRVLGASRARTLVHVTLPSLLPGILSAASMAYVVSLSQYFLTLLVGGGSVKTLTVVMFPFLLTGDRTIASAYALLFLVATLAVFFLFEWVLKRLGLRETRTLFS